MRAGAFALAASILLPLLPVAGQTSDIKGELAAVRHQVESADYRLSGRLVRVDGSGARTSYGVNIKTHWFPGVLRVLLQVTSPSAARVHVLLEMRPGGKSAIQIAHPGDVAATVLPFDKWDDGPLGEVFSYEDFMEAQYFWAGQRDMGKVQFGARNCDLLRSTPSATEKTHFAAVKSWLDHESGFPVYVEKMLKGSGNVKEFTYFGLRQTRGVWWASQVEAKSRGRAGSVLLIIDRGTPNAHLTLQDFGLAQLNHF